MAGLVRERRRGVNNRCWYCYRRYDNRCVRNGLDHTFNTAQLAVLVDVGHDDSLVLPLGRHGVATGHGFEYQGAGGDAAVFQCFTQVGWKIGRLGIRMAVLVPGRQG